MSNVNQNFVSGLTAIVFNDSQGVSRLNVSGTLKQNITKLKLALTMMVMPENSTTYNKFMFRTEIDSCNIQRGAFGAFFAAMIGEILKNFSNMSKFCPIDKGLYYLSNFGVTGIEFLPQFITNTREGNERKWEATLETKCKFANSKSLVRAITLKVYGTTVF